MNNKSHSIHPFYPDPDHEPLFAVIPNDGTRGYNIGELREVIELRDSLNNLIEQGTHDGEINHLHEQLGYQWITIPEAIWLVESVRNISIPKSTISLACRSGKIRGAEKRGRDWRFPQAQFLGWYARKYRKGDRANNATKQDLKGSNDAD